MEGPQNTKKRRKRMRTQRKTMSPQEILEPKVEPQMVVPNSISKEKKKELMKSLWDKI